MTRGELKTRVGRVLGLSFTSASDDDVAEAALLNQLANEAVIDILSRTRVHVRKAAILLDEGVTEFEIDDLILRLFKAYRGDVQLNLEAADSTGFRLVGYNRIVLNLAGAGDDFVAYYTPRPTPMTDDTHDPNTELYGNIPPEFHRAILNYMLWWAADAAGDQGAGRGERYRILYEGRDGMGNSGSDLGRIKTSTNTRISSMVVKRNRPILMGDTDVRYWS